MGMVEWQGAMVIHFGGLRDANPPYDGVKDGCLITGDIGLPGGTYFFTVNLLWSMALRRVAS
jgi:hypothetical protein